MTKRKYEVRGTDALDDLHSFRTDDRERAEEILELMREDRKDVELIEAPRADAYWITPAA